MRWAIVAGGIDPGSGPATERTGQAFLDARTVLGRAKPQRRGLTARTGDEASDVLLDALGPLLPALLEDLTERQRVAARLALIEGLRRSEIAAQLHVSRATVSVLADRAWIRELGGLARGLARIFASGEERAAATLAKPLTDAGGPA
jgi:hypothetical protein